MVAPISGLSQTVPNKVTDVLVTLTARRSSDGKYTLNGTSPGPEIRAVKGQLVQVNLPNSGKIEILARQVEPESVSRR